MKRLINVAYADDHSIVRKGIISLLEDFEHIKFIAEGENGKILLEKIAALESLPDVCLIDINMPVMNGYELLIEVKKRWPQIPCIVVSVFSDEHVIIEFIKLGVNGYLHKSCSTEDICNALQKVITDGYFYNHLFNEKIVKNIVSVKNKASSLNEREIEFLKYICSDLSYSDIAAKLGTTFKTIDGIRMRLCKKLGINSRIGLVIASIRLGYYIVGPQYINQENSKN